MQKTKRKLGDFLTLVDEDGYPIATVTINLCNNGNFEKTRCRCCGMLFQPKNSRHFFCNIICSRRYHKKMYRVKNRLRINTENSIIRHKIAGTITHCEYCGKKLEGRRLKYCTVECQKADYKKVYTNKNNPVANRVVLKSNLS